MSIQKLRRTTYDGVWTSDTNNNFKKINEIIDVVNAIPEVSVEPLIYKALISMDNDSTPPYIVSTDSNGDINPFVNTIGDVVFSVQEGGGGYVDLTLAGAFPIGKTFCFIEPVSNSNLKGWIFDKTTGAGDFIRINRNLGTAIALFNYTSIKIEVYP